jgi:hypothetical protein
MEMLLLCALAPKKVHYNPPPAVFWAVWLGILALVILVAYAAARERRKRREGFEQVAMEVGFLFTEKPDDALAEHLAQIKIASARPDFRPRFSHVLQGNAGGGEVIIGDRTVGAGKSQSTTTVFAFKFATPFPPFMLVPENLLWHIAEKLGYSDIDIDGAPDFSRRFFLHGQDEAAVRALFKPEVTQAFEQLDAKTQWYVSGSGQWLVFSRPGRRIRPQQIRELMQTAEPIVSAFRRAQGGSVFG